MRLARNCPDHRCFLFLSAVDSFLFGSIVLKSSSSSDSYSSFSSIKSSSPSSIIALSAVLLVERVEIPFSTADPAFVLLVFSSSVEVPCFLRWGRLVVYCASITWVARIFCYSFRLLLEVGGKMLLVSTRFVVA